MLLYVSIRQTFKIIYIPFYRADVSLVTVLRLTTRTLSSNDQHHQHQHRDHDQAQGKIEGGIAPLLNKKYFIASQNDLYQTSEWIKFVLPWSIGYTLLIVAQFWATIMCVFGAAVGWPVSWIEEQLDSTRQTDPRGGTSESVENDVRSVVSEPRRLGVGE